MYCNGMQIRKLRAQLGYTQEKLAAMSGVNIRTIQRAENDGPLELETFNQLAQALATTPLAIQNRKADDSSSNENGFVVLRPTLEGAKLVVAIQNAFEATIEYDAEPTDETIDPLVQLVGGLRSVQPQPWDYRWVVHGDGKPSDMDVLRLQLEARKLITLLASKGIDVFFGTYLASRIVPYADLDTGDMSASSRQKPERCTVVKVRISDSGPDRIKIPVKDEWKEPDLGFDDEIPF